MIAPKHEVPLSVIGDFMKRAKYFKTVQLIFIQIVLIAGVVNGQQLEYDIHWFGKVGTLKINQIHRNDSLIIKTNSEVKVPFYKLNWITSTSQKDGVLYESSYAQLLNDEKREYTEIHAAKNGQWIMTTTDGTKENITINSTFMVSMMYFKEPVQETHIFSERFGKSLELQNLGNGHYKLLLPDQNYVEYYYENGVCKIVKAKNGSRTIKMTLSEDS